jgi:hypothetical protein
MSSVWLSPFAHQQDHSDDHADRPDWKRQCKEEAGNGALHAAVVKVSAGRAEALSNLSKPSG